MDLTFKEVIFTIFQIICLYCESLCKMLFPGERRNIDGKRVVITGGGHGIGRAMALEFGRLGAVVILWDIHQGNINDTATEVRRSGATVHTYLCDVSRADDIRRAAGHVMEDVGGVDILVNNAGILNGGRLLELLDDDIRKTFEVNILAQFWTVREFLPGMMERDYGYILNVASASAKSGTAYLSDYSSSKAAVLVFSEALQEELVLLGHRGIRVTVVCPAFVNTGLCRYPKDRFNRMLSPKETAVASIDGMLRGQFMVRVPTSLWFGMKFSDLLPDGANMRLKTSLNMGIDPQYITSRHRVQQGKP